MLETALLPRRSAIRTHAVRVSLPAVIALHGAVLAGFVVASAWNAGEPPEPSLPVVFGRLASLPPPRGGGGSHEGVADVRRSHAANPPIPRIDVPRDASPVQTNAGEAISGDGTPSGPGSGTVPGDPGGADGGAGDVLDIGDSGADQPLVPGGDVTYPSLVRRVEPEYPRAAILTRSEGVVILEAVITTSGDVEEVRVLKSANALLDDAAMRAVRQWTYRPATLGGRAVRVRLTVTVRFSIPAA